MRALGTALLLVVAAAIVSASAPAAAGDEFFIVSSVDADKGTIVVKRPTETTLTMRVTDKTRCTGLKGEAIRFTDLRAGDTVFVTSAASPSGPPVASTIRRSPMTVEELHRRYLRF
ncbi:MAG TPA: hypothetical protein VKG01_04410 [Thermoanaerobaculia bacterium]|nr:hypothetical protein [Thermoanaerobaculia bacterium]